MADRKVAIRFGTEGKAQIVADLGEIGTSGDAAFNRVAKAAARAGEDATAAIERANRQADKLAALMPGLNPGKLDMYAGVTDGTRKSAEQSAAVFGAAFEQMERRADALRAAIDPVYAAQQRFNAEIGEARVLVSAGAISLDDYAAKLRQEQAALDAVAGTNDKVAASTKRTGSAFASAAPQIQDLFVQISMGSNPVNALVVQGGQLAGQLQYAEGRAGSFARMLMGPWGVGFQVALLVMGPLVSKLWEQSEAEEAAKKAAEEHRKAMLDLADAQGTALRTAERKQAIDVANIKIALDAAIATRQQTQALLEQAVAQERIDRQRASAPGQRGENASLSAAVTSNRAAGLEALLTRNQGDLDRLQKGFDLGVARLVGMKIDARSTPTGIVNAQYERARADAMEKYAGNPDLLATRLRRLNDTRDAELKKVQDTEAAQRKLNTTRDADAVSATTLAKVLRDALPGVRITATTNGKHVPGSDHYKNRAVDFVPAGGMGSMTKDDIRQLLAARGIKIRTNANGVEQLFGPGDKGHSDHFHVAVEGGKLALDNYNASAKLNAVAIREAAAAHKELEGDLEGLVRLLDPARAAGDAYAQTLLTIAKAEQAGMLTQGEALGYRLTAAQQERDRRGKELVQASTAMFGGEDPLKDLLDRGQREKEQQVDLWNENRQRGMESYRSVADFYLNAMNGGTRSIWDLFRQNGLRVLSELLAKWTVGQSGGGGGLLKLLGLAGSASGSFDGSAIRSGANASLDALPKFAVGTEYASEGWAEVGEFGKELVRLPRGSQVKSAAATRGMMASNDNAGSRSFHFDLRGAVMTQDLLNQMNAIGDGAAMRGAAGGSAMGQAEQKATGARKLGRKWGA